MKKQSKTCDSSGCGACCCKCHTVKHLVMALSLVAVGLAGLLWEGYFLYALYWALLVNGLLCLGKFMCKCC